MNESAAAFLGSTAKPQTDQSVGRPNCVCGDLSQLSVGPLSNEDEKADNICFCFNANIFRIAPVTVLNCIRAYTYIQGGPKSKPRTQIISKSY